MSNYHVQTLGRHLTAGSFGNPLGSLYATLVAWQQRYELRQHLLELDDYLLEDIGFSRLDAKREAAKPFWRD